MSKRSAEKRGEKRENSDRERERRDEKWGRGGREREIGKGGPEKLPTYLCVTTPVLLFFFSFSVFFLLADEAVLLLRSLPRLCHLTMNGCPGISQKTLATLMRGARVAFVAFSLFLFSFFWCASVFHSPLLFQRFFVFFAFFSAIGIFFVVCVFCTNLPFSCFAVFFYIGFSLQIFPLFLAYNEDVPFSRYMFTTPTTT